MSRDESDKSRSSALLVRLGVVLAGALSLGLLLAPGAFGAYEQMGCFAGSQPGLAESCKPVAEEKFGEEVQLGGVGGLAVNVNGTGGVPTGTVYAATRFFGETRVAMFEPTAGGGLKFVESWQVLADEEPYERCGPPGELPSGETVHPSCSPQALESGGTPVDVEVDQASGNVFVFGGFLRAAGGEAEIIEYSATGGSVIARFGEQAPQGQTIAESPGKVHRLQSLGTLAVNGASEVLVSDEFIGGSERYNRMMVFKQSPPGDYTHYVYAGEVMAGPEASHKAPREPVTDAAGNVYVIGGEETRIEEYAPQSPGGYPAPAGSPVCSFGYEPGGILGLTVDAPTGEVFFYSYKPPKRVRRLGPCNPGTGKFKESGTGEVGEIKLAPQRGDLYALALDPVRKATAGRPAGTLYGATPTPTPVPGTAKGEPGQSALGYIFALAEENPPQVLEESVAHVGTGSAQLRALIDPKGFRTRYVFQYLSEAEYLAGSETFAGAKEAPFAEATLEGTGPQSVAVGVTGLVPDTPYIYRVVATSHCAPPEPSKVCETDGVPASLHTYPLGAGSLLDTRAWELVSPAQKDGGQVLPADPRAKSCAGNCKPGGLFEHFPMQSGAGGNEVAYEGTAFSASEGAAVENQYLSKRTEAGWVTQNPTPSLLASEGGLGYTDLSTGFGRAVIAQRVPVLAPTAPPGYKNLYTQPTAEPLALVPLVSTAPTHRSGVEFAIRYAGASADGQRVFFEANDALTAAGPSAPAAPLVGVSEFDLYEWHAGQLALVGVLPGNAGAEPGAFGNAGAHAISADGTRAFWQGKAGKVFVREGGEVSREIPGSGSGVGFLAAAADGSRVLLASGRIYDLQTEMSTDLSEGQSGFEGILGQSEDLTALYFTDTAVLPATVGEENANKEKPEAGKHNLYAWQQGSGAHFVTQLLSTDNSGLGTRGSGISDWAPAPAARTAQASPGGRFVTFLSRSPLTGYDNTGPCGDETGTGGLKQAPCPEVFLYDSVTQELSCASCNRSGARPLGWSVLRRINGPAFLPQPRYLSEAGRLYFDSQDSLSPADSNEGAEDVYEYEPTGVGSCKHEGGCVALISAGREGEDSNFVAMNEGDGQSGAGADVFFTTRDRLVSADNDQLIDLYDAREGGGFGFESQLGGRECEGEACQLAPGPPAEATPASPAFSGPGNVKPAKGCPKGKVKRNGKCVKKKATHQKHKAKRKRGGSR